MERDIMTTDAKGRIVRITRIDPQAKSIWINGQRIGFVEARRKGFDVEALQGWGR